MIRGCIRATESKRYRKPVGHRYRFDNTGNGRIYKLEMVGFINPGNGRIYKLEMVGFINPGNGRIYKLESVGFDVPPGPRQSRDVGLRPEL